MFDWFASFASIVRRSFWDYTPPEEDKGSLDAWGPGTEPEPEPDDPTVPVGMRG